MRGGRGPPRTHVALQEALCRGGGGGKGSGQWVPLLLGALVVVVLMWRRRLEGDGGGGQEGLGVRGAGGGGEGLGVRVPKGVEDQGPHLVDGGVPVLLAVAVHGAEEGVDDGPVCVFMCVVIYYNAGG